METLMVFHDSWATETYGFVPRLSMYWTEPLILDQRLWWLLAHDMQLLQEPLVLPIYAHLFFLTDIEEDMGASALEMFV